MENYNVPNSFEEYMEQIKNVVKNNRKEYNNIGRAIREINFHESEVEANFQYFKDCYDDNHSPEYVVTNLKYNEDELFRKVEKITDDFILSEIKNRDLTRNVLEDTDTFDIEYELEDRWDATMVKTSRLNRDDLIDLLKDKGYYDDFMSTKAIICDALGFSNSFAYTKEDIIREIERIF